MQPLIEIHAYNTHYEVTNYDMGDCTQLERELSIWDESTYSAITYFYYDKETKIFYVPRGFNATTLRELLDKPITRHDICNPMSKLTFSMVLPPRNDIQREGVRFLVGKEEYGYNTDVHQMVLSLVGGGGKTYCTVAACSVLNVKPIIICHNDIILNQWIDRITEYTNLPKSSIVVLKSSKKMNSYLDSKYDKELIKNGVYIATHSLLNSYMKTYGFKSLNELFIRLGIGVKIVDEAHKNFTNLLMIDYATHVWKSFYLTATFGRTDPKENNMFQKCFNEVYKLKRDTEDMGIEKTVTYIVDLIDSDASMLDIANMMIRRKRGYEQMSLHKLIDYEMGAGVVTDRIIHWLNWYYIKHDKTGQTFVLSSKIESCNEILKLIKKHFPDMKSCVHHSESKVGNLADYDIICATAKMLDTGTDLDDLMMIINTESFTSQVTTDQLSHRLMRGKDNKQRFFIDIVDASIPAVVTMFKKRKKTFNQFVKQTITINPNKKG